MRVVFTRRDWSKILSLLSSLLDENKKRRKESGAKGMRTLTKKCERTHRYQVQLLSFLLILLLLLILSSIFLSTSLLSLSFSSSFSSSLRLVSRFGKISTKRCFPAHITCSFHSGYKSSQEEGNTTAAYKWRASASLENLNQTRISSAHHHHFNETSKRDTS